MGEPMADSASHQSRGESRMAEVPETINAGSNALVKLSNPAVYAPVLSFVLIIIMAALMYGFRQDWREERAANVKVLKEMAESIRDLDIDFRTAGIARQLHHRKDD